VQLLSLDLTVFGIKERHTSSSKESSAIPVLLRDGLLEKEVQNFELCLRNRQKHWDSEGWFQKGCPDSAENDLVLAVRNTPL